MSWLDEMLETHWDGDYADEAEGGNITCNRCGTKDLEWQQVGFHVYDEKSQYILIDLDGNPHNCPPAGADEFEIIEDPT